jgi:CBS domain containing-hemolysin-like protein
VAALLFVVFSALLACIDGAMVMADEIKLAIMLENPAIKEKSRKRLTKIGAKRDKHMAAMMVFSTLTSVLSNSMLGAMAYGKMQGPYVVMFIVANTYSSLVFARTLPKIFARTNYDKILLRFDWLARLVYVAMTPMVYLTLMWVDLFNLKSKRQMSLSELKSTINYYRQEGLLETTEETMLQNVFRIKKFTLSDLAQTCSMPYVEKDLNVIDCTELAQTFTGKQVLVQSKGEIVGVMYYHDMAARIISRKGGKVEEICKAVIVGQHSDNLMEVLARMKESKVSKVVVLAEDGKPLDVVSAKSIYTHILTSSIEQPAPRMLG